MTSNSLSLSPEEKKALSYLQDFLNWNDADRVLRNVQPISKSGQFQEHSEVFLAKMTSLMIDYLANAISFKQIEQVYRLDSRHHCFFNRKNIKRLILARWAEITLTEINRAYSVSEIMAIYHLCPPLNHQLKRAALARWDKLSLEGIKYSQSITELKEVLNNCPPGGKARKLCLKMLKILKNDYQKD